MKYEINKTRNKRLLTLRANIGKMSTPFLRNWRYLSMSTCMYLKSYVYYTTETKNTDTSLQLLF